MNWLVALLGGVAVLLVTMVADRMGPRTGGLLATAPVTSIVGVGWMLLHTADPAQAKLALLSGGYSLVAAIAATWCYCGAVLFLIDRYRRQAVSCGLVIFTIVYGVVILALRVLVAPSGALLCGSAVFAVLMYILAGRMVHRPPTLVRSGHATPLEYLLRMLTGIVVIRLVQWAALLDIRMAGALSVFPGVFVISLGVMGLRGSPRFSLQAARAGFLGMLGVLAFLCGYLVWLPWDGPTYWRFTVSTATAVSGYFLVIASLACAKSR